MEKQYRTSVRTDNDYDDLPEIVEFKINEATAREIDRLSALVKANLKVLQSAAGFYIGTVDEDGFPDSRESQEYWPTKEAAKKSLTDGSWTRCEAP